MALQPGGKGVQRQCVKEMSKKAPLFVVNYLRFDRTEIVHYSENEKVHNRFN